MRSGSIAAAVLLGPAAAAPARARYHLVTRGCGMDPQLWTLVDAADASRRSVGSDLDRCR